MKWEIKMNKQRELKKEGAGLLYDRMQLLIECYKDERFKDWCRDNNDTRVDYLNRELSDIGHEFLYLKTLVDNFPSREDWTSKSVQYMAAAVKVKEQEERRKQREIDEKARPPKPPKHQPVGTFPSSKSASFKVTDIKAQPQCLPQGKPLPPPQPVRKQHPATASLEATISQLRMELKAVKEERDALRKKCKQLESELKKCQVSC